MKKQPVRCFECGSPMVRDVRPDTVTWKGTSVEIALPGWYCTGEDCNEVLLEGPDSDVLEEAFNALRMPPFPIEKES
jgi:HTH-type transcriptional regulator/antitoxin MqsA